MLDSSKVMLGNKEDYEVLKDYRSIILDYDRILEFCPLYNEIRSALKKKKFISQSKVQKIFEESYKNTSLYHKLVMFGLAESDILKLMSASMNYNYLLNKLKFDRVKGEAIKICDLIDYIGHYPNTYPVPKKEEKNLKMEKLLEKYDIMVRYHMNDDLGKMQIMSDDVVRLIETLKKYLDDLKEIEYYIFSEKEWIFYDSVHIQDELFIGSNRSLEILSQIRSVPKSVYQENGVSKREEGKMYLRRNYGKDII